MADRVQYFYRFDSGSR